MKVLMINKFLYPNGGSETYIFKLGQYLQSQGHEVQYFGMEHAGRCVGNRVESYTSDMDFHGGSKLQKLTYPIKTIYSAEARKKIRLVLDDFQPDVCHLNNFNFQLTPSIILEIRKWEKESGRKVRIVFTAHDSQLVCPNHLMTNPITQQRCDKCLGRHFINCIKGKCIHGSLAKSAIGALEGYYWAMRKTYGQIDAVISPSHFLGGKLSADPILKERLVVLHNFIDRVTPQAYEKKDYVVYFGRYSQEKGIATLLEVVKQLPDIPFIFAGNGPLEEEVNKLPNIENRGFLSGDALRQVISQARFSVFSSECYENCPFSVMESQMYGTPVLGANIGGIPELIQEGKTGELFEAGNGQALKDGILNLWNDPEKCAKYSENCAHCQFDTIDKYCEKLIQIYKGEE
mgnify:CR=1 FL=1